MILVEPHVDQRAAVARPRETGDIRDDVCKVTSGREIAYLEGEILRTGDIGEIGVKPMIGTGAVVAEFEIALALGKRGPIDQEFLGAA